MLLMNGSVAKALRSIEAAGRDSRKRASVMYICSSSLTSFFEPSMTLWIVPSAVAREQVQELGLERLGAGHSSKWMNAPLSVFSSSR